VYAVNIFFGYPPILTSWQQEEAFPNPTTFDATRTPRERYLRADVAFKAIGADIAWKPVVQVLRSILAFDNVRRGPGQSGKLARFEDSSIQYLRYVYLDAQQIRSPWPTSLVILYDVPASSA
jgi:linoleate 10R-lipoxygenase